MTGSSQVGTRFKASCGIGTCRGRAPLSKGINIIARAQLLAGRISGPRTPLSTHFSPDSECFQTLAPVSRVRLLQWHLSGPRGVKGGALPFTAASPCRWTRFVASLGSFCAHSHSPRLHSLPRHLISDAHECIYNSPLSPRDKVTKCNKVQNLTLRQTL